MWAGKRYNTFTRGMASQGIELIVKRLTFTIVSVGVFSMLSVIFLVGYGIHRINQAIPLTSEPDMKAMEQLLTTRKLKENMWNILDSNQAKSIKEWRNRASLQMDDMVKSGGSSLKGTVEKYKKDVKQELTKQYKFINDKWFNGRTGAKNKVLKKLE